MKQFYVVVLTLLSLNYGFSQDCSQITMQTITNPGPYSVATMLETDGLRNGPNYSGATVYYPTNATPPFASIVIVPGFLSAQSSVQDWGPYYASHGIIAMTIGTNSGWDFPDDRANALLDAIETLKQENTRNASPLAGKIDTESFAVSGWSMGGGGSQIAATIDPSLKAVVALCPWLEAGENLNHDVPVLILSGQADPTAPPDSHANVHYDITPATTDKLKYEFANGNHSVANYPSSGNGDIGRIALSWLKTYLLQENCYCPLLLDAPTTASSYDYNISCPAAAVCGMATDLTETSISVSNLTLTWEPQANAQAYQVAGRKADGAIKIFGEQTENFRTFTSGIQPNTTYQWSVRVLCDDVWTDFAPIKEFTTNAAKVGEAISEIDIFANAESNLTAQVYPNPATNEVTILFATATQNYLNINVLDVTGRVLMSQKMKTNNFETKTELDISNLENGYYLVEINNGLESKICKLNVVR